MKRTPKKIRTNIINLFILFVLLLLIPFTVGVVLLQTRYFSRASELPQQATIVNNKVNVMIDLPSSLVIHEQYDVPVIINTNGNEIVGIDSVITYDPQKLELLSVTPSVFSQRHNEVNDKTLGVYKLAQHIAHTEQPMNGTDLLVLKLTFLTKSVGNTSVSISPETITAGLGVVGQQLLVVSEPSVTTIFEVIPTSTPFLTPTPTPVGSIIPNAPSWFNLLPINLRGFLEQLYLTVYVFQRQTNLRHLLEGIFSP